MIDKLTAATRNLFQYIFCRGAKDSIFDQLYISKRKFLVCPLNRNQVHTWPFRLFKKNFLLN